MHIKELDWEINSNLNIDTHERSKGCHVSDIIGSIFQTLYPDRFSQEGPLPWDKFMAGWAWEEIIGRAMAKVHQGDSPVIAQPGELSCDGITGTPDGYNTIDDAIEEYKCTWVSARHDLTSDKFEHWLMQGKAYCWMARVDTIIYRVFFVNGDYQYLQSGNSTKTHPPGPQTKAWHITYEPEELLLNWQILTRHAKKRGWI